MTSITANQPSRIPKAKNSVFDHVYQNNAKKQTTFDFSGFELQKSKTVDESAGMQRTTAGLTDATNVSSRQGSGCNGSNHGYINKIRRSSVSGEPKEKKVPHVVSTHHPKVGFRPTGFHHKRTDYKPSQGVSPMDIDSPLVRIRNMMTCVPHGVTDIDAVCDPLKNTDYAQDICDYLQCLERRFTFPRNYLHNNKNITANTRALLMDWLIQVQSHQDLSQYTLHLCVALIDRFICKHPVQIAMLQLVGITSMLISAKYYERFPPEISDLCHLTDNTYTPTQVLKMERAMLRKLDFSLNIPGPVVFLERFLLVSPCDQNHLIQSMSMYMLDLTLIDLSFVHIFPSLLAASAIYVSREMLNCPEKWGTAYSYYTKYSENDLMACNRALRHLLARQHRLKLQGAHTKYTHANYHGISNHHSLKHISLHPTELWPDQHTADEDSQEMGETAI